MGYRASSAVPKTDKVRLVIIRVGVAISGCHKAGSNIM